MHIKQAERMVERLRAMGYKAEVKSDPIYFVSVKVPAPDIEYKIMEWDEMGNFLLRQEQESGDY